MREFKGMGWFSLNDKLVLMIADDCKSVPIIGESCGCDYILCSNRVAKKWKRELKQSGATIISFN